MYLTSRSFCGHSPISCAHLLVQFVFSIIFNALSRKKAQLFHRTIPVILAKSSFASSFESEWKTYQLICFNVRIILVRLVFRIKSRNKIIKSQFHLQLKVAELTLFRWKSSRLHKNVTKVGSRIWKNVTTVGSRLCKYVTKVGSRLRMSVTHGYASRLRKLAKKMGNRSVPWLRRPLLPIRDDHYCVVRKQKQLKKVLVETPPSI